MTRQSPTRNLRNPASPRRRGNPNRSGSARSLDSMACRMRARLGASKRGRSCTGTWRSYSSRKADRSSAVGLAPHVGVGQRGAAGRLDAGIRYPGKVGVLRGFERFADQVPGLGRSGDAVPRRSLSQLVEDRPLEDDVEAGQLGGHGLSVSQVMVLRGPPPGQHVYRRDDPFRLFRRLYSTESARACQEASMIFSETPTVDHTSLPSVDSMVTRTLAAVEACGFTTRTL